MAVTYKHLWSRIVSWENLVSAYEACRRRKRYKPDAVRFHFAWETNLAELQTELIAGDYRPGEYRNFRITDPKPRKISAAPFRDRVVHHALVRVLEPLFERRFIFDSYACRRGKGTHRAIKRAQKYTRLYPYFLKSDIVRFFPNIDHEILLEHLGSIIRDQRVMELIGKILKSGEHVLSAEASHEYFPGDDLFALSRPRGLPIGNLTSQFFANIYLDLCDHYVKEELRVGAYVRYADDFVVFARTKQELWHIRDRLVVFLEKLRLRLHRDKTHVGACRSGIRFLGLVVRPESLRLQQRAIKRFSKRLRRLQWLYDNRRIDTKRLRRSLDAWRRYAMYANSLGLRKMLWRRARFMRRARRSPP
jgi:retron-type reverse transcriptase